MPPIKRRILRLVCTLIVAMAGLWVVQPPVYSQPLPPMAGSATPATLTPELRRKIHPLLLKQLLNAGQQSTADIRVVVMLREQADLNAKTITSAASPLDRRAALVSVLQATADRSQAGVRAFLASEQAAGRAIQVRPLWIVNAIGARVAPSVIYALAARDDVRLIQPDQYRHWIDIEPPTSNPQLPTSNLQSPTSSVEWGIAQIRADQVWSALNISGTGVVVANMDTGVDWQHPALLSAYRGYNPKGLANHRFSWFDATDAGALYPYDGNGHGTHTMGTLVGAGGIGVAPGAKWIAARVLDRDGNGYDSWIHAGFQWILAPGGNPGMAPNVLSNSWATDLGSDAAFRNDVIALNAAGIATFFSNGNAGPGEGTVGAPASYPESFGVGATDPYDLIALFSSRGPSPFGPIKPDISAPGVNVRSSYLGGTYAVLNGTSMASPHVAGVAALVLSAQPGLTITETRYVLTSTAVHPTIDTYPNNLYGWGRVDALAAVLSVAHSGVLSGTVTRSDNAAPIANAALHAVSIIGTQGAASTDAAGTYALGLAPSTYTVTASAFGYQTQTQFNVPVITNTQTRRDFTLTPLPTGVVQGRITDLTGTLLLTSTLVVQDTPVSVTTAGIYSIALPGGTYILRAQSNRHRVVTATVVITAGQTVTRDFALADAPSTLLVDSGAWLYASEIGYYRQALDDLGYAYTDWPIRDLSADVPTTATLAPYDVVVWSSPLDGPGYIGAGNVISTYLNNHGRLFLSGQDIGFWDGLWSFSPYYTDKLLAQFVDDNAAERTLIGHNLFAGQAVTIAGAGGADNQLYPDVIQSLDPLLTDNAFEYAPGQSGGQSIGLCRPYRAVYLSYGFEAINARAARAEVMSRTLAYFARPPVTGYYALTPDPNVWVGPTGSVVTGTLNLYNLDEVAPTTTFSISVSSPWAATISPAVAALASCKQQSLVLSVSIPAGAPRNTAQTVTVYASPIVSPGLVVSTALAVKSPAQVLLLDDDRWYPVDGPYRSALAANGISYDMWRVPTSWAGIDPGVPSAERLSWYPEVIWFTGYDWYQTLTDYNEFLLTQYLGNGGRLLLSSQDYLGEHGLTAFGRDRLGVLTDSNDLSATVASGPAGSLFDGLVANSLTFSYTNYSDALAPQPGTQVALVGNRGWPVALAHADGSGKALFMAFGFEGLPESQRGEAMNRAVGYLSWLGSSSARFDRPVASAGERVTLTIAIVNDGPAPIAHAGFTTTLPLSVTYAGGDPLTWSGSLAAGQRVTYTLAMTIDSGMSAGSSLNVPIQWSDQDHDLQYHTLARLPIDVPVFALDLNPSNTHIRPREAVTWTLTARNLGPAAAASTAITAVLPFGRDLVSGTLRASVGAATELSGTIGWLGTIPAGQAITLTYQMTGGIQPIDRVDYASAILSDGRDLWHVGNWLTVTPFKAYLPVLRKNS